MSILDSKREEILRRLDESIKKIPAEISALEDERLRKEAIYKEASGQGDARENAGMQDAKEQLAMVNSQLRNLQSKYDAFQRFNPGLGGGYVQDGATVHLYLEEQGADFYYLLVPKELGDAEAGALSITTPVAKSIIGRQAGDTVTVKTISGSHRWTIKEVR